MLMITTLTVSQAFKFLIRKVRLLLEDVMRLQVIHLNLQLLTVKLYHTQRDRQAEVLRAEAIQDPEVLTQEIKMTRNRMVITLQTEASLT